jgi:predicted alpha/beta-fold hydrolase
VVRLDLRGTGAGFPLARGSYNAGCSGDVRAALETVHRLAPQSPLWLAGVSLGANVSLKLAGEAADRPVLGLAKVATIAPPVDLAECVRLIEQPRNRFYEVHFLRDLVREAQMRARHFREPPPQFPRRLSLRQFDDLYTAPRGGFKDASDYYARSSSAQFVPRVQLPTLILTARDDPFVTCEPIARLQRPANVEVRITDHGGHVGYLGRDGTGGMCWGEWQLAEWLIRS